MNKTILVFGRCADPELVEVPDLCSVVLTQANAERIQELARAVKALGVEVIEEPFRSTQWYNYVISPSELGPRDCNLDAIMGELAKVEDPVEEKTLRVTKEGFAFTSVEPEAPKSQRVTTKTIPFSELEHEDPFVRVE